MAQLIVSAAGAAIGFAVGGPIGAQVGWVAGSLLGASLGPSQQGPRLSDTKVQVSSYGAALPIVYGGTRLAGNVVWSTALQETATESGGKGGPSTTSYSYAVSCAVAICEGPIVGIRRIWADTKLIYDISEDADGATQAASSAIAEYFVVYPGSESQLPDPTIEAAEGAGNVEAMRGTAYIVFTSLPLADYGNRVPNFSFEITTDAPAEVPTEYLSKLVLEPWRFTDTSGDTTALPQHNDGENDLDVEYMVDSSTYTTAGEALAALPAGFDVFVGYYTSENDLLSVFEGGAVAGDARYIYAAYNKALPDVVVIGGGGAVDSYCSPMPCGDSGASYMASGWVASFGASITPGHYGIARMFVGSVDGPVDVVAPFDGSGTVTQNCVSCAPNGEGYFPVSISIPNVFIRIERKLTLLPVRCSVGDPCERGLAQLPSNADFCISCDGEVTPNGPLDLETSTFKQLQALEQNSSTVTAYPLGPVLRPSHPDYSNAAFWDAQAALVDPSLLTGTNPAVVTQAGTITAVPELAGAGSVLLSDVVADICERSDLSAGEVDVSALTDTVLGYQIARQMPARQAIEPLRQAFYFDAVENGDEIVFVKRGGASVVTIGPDDLGAAEDGAAESLTAPRRAQETELPAVVNVAYPARSADYQTGTQQARRLTTGSQQVLGVELSVVMADTKAAEVADVLMYDAWQGRTDRGFSTARKFSRYLPGDVVTLDDGSFTYTGRLIEKTESGQVIRWTLRDEAPAVYSPNVTASATSGGGSAVRFDGPMRLLLLDIPIMRDVDDGTGLYASWKGYAPHWSSGSIYGSPDGVTYGLIAAVSAQNAIGPTTTALQDWAGGVVMDEISSVTVDVGAQTLASTTRELMLSAGTNACVIGAECLQFRTATLVAPGIYVLTGLLRGRRGTEWAMTGHYAGETFAALPIAGTGMRRLTQSTADIGLPVYYKGVSPGEAVADVTAQTLTFADVGQKPFSPVMLRAAATGGSPDEYALTWARRTRRATNFTGPTGAVVPLGEATEAYSVDVVRAGVVISTTSASTQSATVAATTGDVINIYQLSEIVGRGYPATVTI